MADIKQVTHKRRAIVYIDGFNLYFAMKEKHWQHMMWLDLVQLGQKLVKPDQDLIAVKYFTARINNNPTKQKRQGAYLDALATTGGILQVVYGNYVEDNYLCQCGRMNPIQGEKQTDVNIATHMLTDSYKNVVDDLILITADSDQVPAMLAVREMGKHVLVVIPPGREKFLEVQFAADSKLELNASKLKQCRLPLKVTTASGFVIECPTKYRYEN